MTEETPPEVPKLPEYPNAREVIHQLMQAVYSITPIQSNAAGIKPMMFLYQGMACGLLLRQEELCRNLRDALVDAHNACATSFPTYTLARIQRVLEDAHKQLDPA